MSVSSLGTLLCGVKPRREQVLAVDALDELLRTGMVRDRFQNPQRNRMCYATPRAYGMKDSETRPCQVQIMARAKEAERVQIVDAKGPGKIVDLGETNLGEESAEEALKVELAFNCLLVNRKLQRFGRTRDLYEPTARAWREDD